MKFIPPAFAQITLADLDEMDVNLDPGTVDDLAQRLVGLAGNRLDVECIQLAGAMLDDMNTRGHAVGRLEHTLVLALLRAAIARTGSVTIGRA